MKFSKLLLLMICAFFLKFSAQSQILNFDFSFTGTALGGGTGTIAGKILGLSEGTGKMPTDIIITSVPLSFGVSTPFSLYPETTISGTGFTVSGGQITAANFNAITSGSNEITFNFNLSGQNINQLYLFTGPHGVKNSLGFSGTTYTPEAVPEPSTYGLMGLGLVGIFFARRFLKA